MELELESGLGLGLDLDLSVLDVSAQDRALDRALDRAVLEDEEAGKRVKSSLEPATWRLLCPPIG
ncbi:hypothetical protein [Endozoicomonas acroporae]|uniref:hypothetical protein n=1 Tax=Endozoicomonas acroporae TaxID=1701104 RepID=UPI001FD4010D|nr:hypothetical protein [Endozoicomonas acroporae]